MRIDIRCRRAAKSSSVRSTVVHGIPRTVVQSHLGLGKRPPRSELERMFLRMCVRGGLPTPEVNAPLNVGGRRLKPDFLWRDAGLIVEADSRRFHDTYSAYQNGRHREQLLQLAGWRVSRCTWEQVESEPQRLAQTIKGLLAQANPRRRDSK